jgi:hypothetical protein
MLAVTGGGPPAAGADLGRDGAEGAGRGVCMPPAGGAGASCSRLGRTGDKIGTLDRRPGGLPGQRKRREPERMGAQR